MSPKRLEILGKMVRDVWVLHASEQPNPKPHHLLPWSQLSEPDKEVDRKIGEALFNEGSQSVDLICVSCNNPLPWKASNDRDGILEVEPCHCKTSEIARLKSREEIITRLHHLHGDEVVPNVEKTGDPEEPEWPDMERPTPPLDPWKVAFFTFVLSVVGIGSLVALYFALFHRK